MEEKKQVKNDLVGRFTWRIENFSTLNESKLHSKSFSIDDSKWRLILFPKGNTVKMKTDKYLSVYLEVPDSEIFLDGWSVTAKFSLHLINQIDTEKTIKREVEHKFNAEQSDWGFLKFYLLNQLHDKNSGYLVNDTCLIEVEVTEFDAIQVSTDKLDSSVPDEPVESVYIKAESFLKSIHKNSSIPVTDTTCEMPLIKDDAILAKECFNNLISIPLKDLVNPKQEMAMIATLSILGDNLSLFSDNQAKEIMNLKATFPSILQKWRESVKVKVSNMHRKSTVERTSNLLEHLVKTEEGIKIEVEELNERLKEMEVQMEVLRSKSRGLKEERTEVSKQTKQVYALAEEQSRKMEDKKPELNLANKELEDMECKWASLKVVFT